MLLFKKKQHESYIVRASCVATCMRDGVATTAYLGHHGRVAVRHLDQDGELRIATDVVILRRAFVFQVLVFQHEALNCRRYVCVEIHATAPQKQLSSALVVCMLMRHCPTAPDSAGNQPFRTLQY